MNAAVINRRGKLQRVQEACSDTNWSRNTLMKVATEANAVIRVGRTVRIDMLEISEEEAVERIEEVKAQLLEQGEDISQYIISEPKRQKFILKPQKWTS